MGRPCLVVTSCAVWLGCRGCPHGILLIGQVQRKGLAPLSKVLLLDVHGDDKLDDTRFTRLKHLVFSKLRHVHLVELRQLIQSQPVIPQVGLGGTLVGGW